MDGPDEDRSSPSSLHLLGLSDEGATPSTYEYHLGALSQMKEKGRQTFPRSSCEFTRVEHASAGFAMAIEKLRFA